MLIEEIWNQRWLNVFIPNFRGFNEIKPFINDYEICYFVSYIEILVFWLIVNVFYFLISLLKQLSVNIFVWSMNQNKNKNKYFKILLLNMARMWGSIKLFVF